MQKVFEWSYSMHDMNVPIMAPPPKPPKLRGMRR